MNQDKITQLAADLAAGKISLQEVQHKLSACLYLAASELNATVNFAQIESAIVALDNELELIIYTRKEEDQTESALATLGKAQRLLARGFV